VPVTAKLSRRFYDTFGDELTNELVEWFNAVDLTYRTDLRDFNDLNFARFDAKLEQRLAEFDTRLNQRLAEFDLRLEQRLTAMEARLGDLRREIETRTISLRAEMVREISQARTAMIRWMFLFWIGTVATIFLAR